MHSISEPLASENLSIISRFPPFPPQWQEDRNSPRLTAYYQHPPSWEQKTELRSLSASSSNACSEILSPAWKATATLLQGHKKCAASQSTISLPHPVRSQFHDGCFFCILRSHGNWDGSLQKSTTRQPYQNAVWLQSVANCWFAWMYDHTKLS